jgi:tetratricopeptide (TPR) repeat protein
MTPKHKKLLKRAAKCGADGDHATAEKLWREYLEHDPNHPAVLFNVGWCIEQRANSPQDRLAAAEYYEKVLQSPLSDTELKANAMNQIGLMCLTIGEDEKAATSFGFALKIKPDHGAAKINLADAHRALGEYDMAASEYANVLDQNPNNPEANMCAGMLALLLGDYPRGWDLYRSRWQVKTFTTKPMETTRPRWNGEPLNGKTIMLWEEQGLPSSALACCLGASQSFAKSCREWTGWPTWWNGATRRRLTTTCRFSTFLTFSAPRWQTFPRRIASASCRTGGESALKAISPARA